MLRHPRLVLFTALLASFAFCVGFLELGLLIVAPFGTVVIGWVTSDAGPRYGWGFSPREMQAVRDADTGQIYLNRANQSGWRDVDHALAKQPGVLRILILGDSNIYGHVVSFQDTVGRQLEAILKEAGVNAEVLAMANSGWSTDQQLEALRQEGMRYAPDLVVLHFCPNDLQENFHWRLPGKFGSRRPVAYELAEGDRLVRQPNPRYAIPLGTRIEESVIRHSEVAKRLRAGWRTFLALRYPKYQLSIGQVAMIRYDLGLQENAPLIVALKPLVGRKDLSEEQLTELFTRYGYADRVEVLLRMSEKVNDQENDPEDTYFVHPKGTDEWPLLFALVREMKNVAESGGAKLLISTDLDDGKWEWERYWHHVQPTEEAKARFMSRNEPLRDFARQHGLGFIEPVHPVERARNDVHPSAAGSKAVARNMFEHLRAAGLIRVKQDSGGSP